jgi:cell division protein FtsI/penicillin-binding protein 2
VELKLDGIAFIPRVRRFYPENNIGSHVLGFVGYVGAEERGRYGLEGFFDEELFGVPGSIKTGRGAQGNLIIINDREYEKAKNGSDLILTINRIIQYTACHKLNETALRHGADGGSIIIMDPKTGGILAMCSWPDYDPNNYKEVEDIEIYNNPAIFSQYEPGSIFKTITMAAALDQGKITPETTYNDEGSVMISGWPKPIKNSDYDTHGGYGEVNMTTVLEKSLNTGAIFAMQQIGPEIFSKYVKDFGFGEKTGIELETESAGNIKNLLGDKVYEIYAATASFGQGISVTPLQMVTAYAAVANGGILMKPYLVKEIVHSDGTKDITQPKQIKRVVSERTAILLGGMLVNVVESGHAKRAGVDGYWVAGKTGTAQIASREQRGYSSRTIHTFVGFAPVEDPKFVMLVKLDDPKGIKFAASSAAPLFGEIAEFLLDYFEVPKER